VNPCERDGSDSYIGPRSGGTLWPVEPAVRRVVPEPERPALEEPPRIDIVPCNIEAHVLLLPPQAVTPFFKSLA